MFNKSKFDNELFHGFNAGIGQSIIGHPLDTYKTWLQVNHCEKITLSNLFRGFSYPALTNGIITALSFKVYEKCKSYDSQYSMIYGGIAAGIITGTLSGYFEYKKISDQVKIKIKYPIAGTGTLLLREIPACLCYYPIYDILRYNNVYIPIAGGIAGVTCWISSYWADVINTYVMSGHKFTHVIRNLTLYDYFKGICVVIPRAFCVNAVGYYCYELSKSIFIYI